MALFLLTLACCRTRSISFGSSPVASSSTSSPEEVSSVPALVPSVAASSGTGTFMGAWIPLAASTSPP